MNIQEFTPEELLGPLNDIERRRPPERLFVADDASLFQIHPKVSVVGSRKASPEGIKRAGKISRLTDIYLLALAAGHGGTLVTFDQSISLSVVRVAKLENLTVL